ncbi:MAG: hypothetical protein P8Z74_15540 [Acidobacteriota bacterium]|jgi:hypothetical protein
MSRRKHLLVGFVVAVVLVSIVAWQPVAISGNQLPRTLASHELAAFAGSGFWSGLGCGLSVAGAIAAVVSPDPVTKVVAGALISAAVSCSTALLFD